MKHSEIITNVRTVVVALMQKNVKRPQRIEP